MKKSILVAILFALVGSYMIMESAIADSNNRSGLGNAIKPPIWSIFKNGKSQSVRWRRHTPNPRFFIYNAGTRNDTSDDLVWDGETGLVWERTPSTSGRDFFLSDDHCFIRQFAGRFGMRLPTMEELETLLDASQFSPALPQGHPFNINTSLFYFSSTTNNLTGNAPRMSALGRKRSLNYSILKTLNLFILFYVCFQPIAVIQNIGNG